MTQKEPGEGLSIETNELAGQLVELGRQIDDLKQRLAADAENAADVLIKLEQEIQFLYSTVQTLPATS